MNKLIKALLALAILGFALYLYMDNRKVNIVDAHHNQYTAEILVNTLPVSDSASIQWWQKNQSEIYAKYNISTAESGGPYSVTIYKFGEGYKEEGNEDRLCFDDIPAQKKCIDKKIIMRVVYLRNGNTKFSFENAVYILKADGEISKSAHN
ncbi:hypothetical protein J2125_000486 [Erwinia toletana]|uniref:DUF943 family protein n=1 Tax=Winslowiella toletana TaxID=92490 RepID=A0ABS4P3S3_9GAMM|nr:DUF943 family protein [Winslowiella toletana]MBP2167294.1 hypothetical protein [Winslowiella toletana]